MERPQHHAASYDRGQPQPRRDLLRLSRRIALQALGRLRAPIETLARLSGTDKIGSHDFMAAYKRFFSKYRNRPITLLEIGVGGYSDLADGGQSLSLWEAYFRYGTIVAIDVYDKRHLSHGRVHVHQCSQIDREGLQNIADKYGGFDLIIDDGSHMNQHQIESFTILFPLLKEDGVYVVEDTQTSYWPVFGGGSVGTPEHAKSATSFFRGLVDGLNHAEYLPDARVTLTPNHLWIRGLYFEHSFIAILKGDNSAKSNWPIDRWAGKLARSVSVSPTPEMFQD